jgi:hypothetical protein
MSWGDRKHGQKKRGGLNLGFPLQSIDALSLCCNNDNGSMIVYLAQNIWSSKCQMITLLMLNHGGVISYHQYR